MSTPNDILQHIRQAAASERAAAGHEDRYAGQMKSAGASMYAAFVGALRASEEFRGRKLDDKAVLRLYRSTKARPWWDEHLKAAKFVDGKGAAKRQGAAYLIQWHVDPSAAQARHAQGKIQQLAAQNRLSKQRASAATRSMNSRYEAPTAKEAQRVVTAATDAASAGRELPPGSEPELPVVTLEDLLGEFNRLASAVRKVPARDRASAMTVIRIAARDIERYVP